MKRNIRLPLLFLLLILGYYLFQHTYGYYGMNGSDDLWYARLAVQYLEGAFHLSKDHYTFRWIPIWFTAWSYKLFGVSEHSSALMPFLFAVLSLVLVWIMAKKRSAEALILLLAFSALPLWSVFYADKLMADFFMAFGVLASLTALYRYRYVVKPNKAIVYGPLLALSIWFAFLSKASILLLGPFYLFIFISDLAQGRYRWFWTFAILVFFSIAGFYFSYVHGVTGSWKSRFIAITENEYFSACSYEHLPFSETIKRVTYDLIGNFVRGGLGLHLLLAFLYLFRFSAVELFQMRDQKSFFASTFLVLFLCINFMSTSLTDYAPLCTDPRHYLFLPGIAALSGIFVLEEFIKTRSHFWPLIIGLALLGLWSFWFEFEHRNYLYPGLFLLVLVYRIVPSTPITRGMTRAGLIILLALPSVFYIPYARSMGYWSQKAILAKHIFPDSGTKKVVISNTIQTNFGHFYNGFKPSHVEYISYSELQKLDKVPEGQLFLFLNGTTRWFSGLSWKSLPSFAQNLPEGFELQEEDMGRQLYFVLDTLPISQFQREVQ